VNLVVILFGAGLGALLSGLMGIYLVVTRPYRRVRNAAAIGLGYVFFGGMSVGSLLLLIAGLDGLRVPYRSSQRDAALYSYAAALAVGIFFVGRSEARWRKSVGLDGKSRISRQQRN